jgi:hypothetical protein
VNTFTTKEQFTESAEYILENSTLLIEKDCRILNGVLYERIDGGVIVVENGWFAPSHKYRFFFNCDDYDYLENDSVEAELEKLFALPNP